MKRLAQIDPGRIELVYWLKGHLKPDEMLQLFSPGLIKCSLAVDWHRAYQDINITNNKLPEMVALYKDRLDKVTPPDKQNARYLYGRMLDDPQGYETLRNAANGDDGSFYAIYAVGNRALVSGQFDEARKWADKLVTRDRTHPMTHKLVKNTLMAQKKYAELDQFLLASFSGHLGDGMVTLERYQLARMQNDQQRAADLKNQILAMVRREAPQNVEPIEALLKSYDATISDDAAAFLSGAYAAQFPNDVSVPILKGDLNGAEVIFEERKDLAENKLLHASLLYLLAKSKKNETLTREYWETIRQELLIASRTAKTFNDMLAGKVPFTFEAARDSHFDVDDKRAVLLVLADRFPKDAVALRALAAKLNFQRDAYALAVKKFLTEPAK